MLYKRVLLSLLVVFISTFCLTANANFDKAIALYQNKDFTEAKEAFEVLAAIGDRSALFNLGVMYYRGEAIERDAIKGYVLMTIANQGLDEPDFSSLIAKLDRSLTPEQKSFAKELMVKLLPTYDIALIKESVFPELLDDKDCEPDVLPLLKKAPLYPRSENRRGIMGITITEYTVSPQGYVRDIYIKTSSSNGFSRVSGRAAKHFRYQPPTNGQPRHGVQNRFTFTLEGGSGFVRTKKIKESLENLKQAAEAGDPRAQYLYAKQVNIYRHFSDHLRGLDLQHRDSVKWFKKSAENGLPHSQYEMGKSMLEGRGCKVDIENGTKWIKAAAISGYSPAQQYLAQEFLSDSERSSTEAALAISWLRNASMGNYYPAKVDLAWELSTTEVTILRDGKEALELLEDDSDLYYDEVRLLEVQA